jgi:predicted DsbA family dithiol-disulfide isomerase
VTVEWLPFELRPFPTRTLSPEGDYLRAAWDRSVYPLAVRMGVPIRLPPVSPQPYTHLAFEGYQYAREHGKGNEYNHRVLAAFFQEGQDIGRADVLARLAGEVGLDAREFREALETRRYENAHRRALHHAYYEAGITSVPTFVVGDRVLTGLQDADELRLAIDAELRKREPAVAAGHAEEGRP